MSASASRPLRTTYRPHGRLFTLVAQRPLIFQSSATSWSSKIMYVGVLARICATSGVTAT
jgi:hypothetical protein